MAIIKYHSYILSIKDEANKAGGKWIIRLKKGLASRCWENLILAMLGEQFMVGEEICGAVISIRYQVRYDTLIFLLYKVAKYIGNWLFGS